jgi:hypothetical protein
VLGIDGEVAVPGRPDDEIHKKPGRKKGIKLSPLSPSPTKDRELSLRTTRRPKPILEDHP